MADDQRDCGEPVASGLGQLAAAATPTGEGAGVDGAEGAEGAGDFVGGDAEGDHGDDGGLVVAARRRARGSGQRVSRLTVRLSAAEHAEVAAAAGAAGVTAAGFTAGAVLAAARGQQAGAGGLPVRVVLGELMATRRQLRGYAVNVNQAAKVLNAGAGAPEWLEAAVEATDAAVARVDEATAAVMRTLR